MATNDDNPENIPAQSDLQIRFNRKPWLGGRNMKRNAYGIFDVSIDTPIPTVPQHQTIVLAAGVFNYQVLARPAVGRHAMVLRAAAQIGAPGGTDTFFLVYREQKNQNLALQTTDVILNSFVGNNGLILPFVGTAGNQGFFSLQSARPVYVPFGFECGVVQTSAAGDTSQLNWIAVEYPETQPLTSLFDF